MPDHAAFLAAVCAHPEDDGPRLVYADWLDEQGDPRGEFIRAQIELERLPPDDASRPRLKARCRELLKRHRSAWLVPGIPDRSFHRGFVEELTVSEPLRLDDVLAVFHRTPVRVLQVRRRSLPFPLSDLVGRPEVRSLSWLDLGGTLVGDDGAAAIARSPHLVRLTRLWLNSWMDAEYPQRIHAAGAAAVARSGTLSRLTELDLNGNAIGDGGLASLAGSPTLGRLERLVLVNNEIGLTGDEAIERLCESRHLTRLCSVDLRDNPLSHAARAALCERFGSGVLLTELGFD
jgi:uncharacterized protein (TIGR02996 family)